MIPKDARQDLTEAEKQGRTIPEEQEQEQEQEPETGQQPAVSDRNSGPDAPR